MLIRGNLKVKRILNSRLKISLALPSKVSYLVKTNLVAQASNLGMGVYASDLPPNHDLFQILSSWGTQFPDLKFGIAIISPFSYEISILQKQASTFFEMYQNRVELGFGIGDPALIPGPKASRFSKFCELMEAFLDHEMISKNRHHISLAGAGQKLLEFAVNQQLGVIFNGIPDSTLITALGSSSFDSKSKLSAYIMAEIGSYENLSPGFVKIVGRILAGLPKTERNRLNISLEQVKLVREGLSNDWKNYQQWLPKNLIHKVSFLGQNKTDFDVFLQRFADIPVKQLILSLSSNDNRKTFFSWYL